MDLFFLSKIENNFRFPYCFNFAIMIRNKVTATIITIGDELLIGQVIDTNSAFIARELNKTGIEVVRRIAIADDETAITNALDSEIGSVGTIIMTGGLGPTSDDITKPTLCKYFNGKWVVHVPTLTRIKFMYKNIYKKNLTAVNIAQANVPSTCEVIVNNRGSAPCMVFEKKKTIVFSMAGVPYEMEGIMEDVISWLKQRVQTPRVIHHTLITTGIGESDLAARIKDFESQLPKGITLAYLPGLGMLRLRLSTTAFDKDQEAAIRKQFSTLKKEVSPFLLSSDDLPPEVKLSRLMKLKGWSMSTAESCTGGKIASLITSVSGASDYYPGSIISYSNIVKEKVLGVKKATLKKYGAVSEEVVKEMHTGLLKQMKTDCGIAVSGIMGPGGGSVAKPVGTVWICVGNRKSQKTRKLHLRFDRKRNIEGTAGIAIYELICFLQDQESPE